MKQVGTQKIIINKKVYPHTANYGRAERGDKKRSNEGQKKSIKNPGFILNAGVSQQID